MGLFDLFKKPHKIHDEVLGTLTLAGFNDPAKDYFEGGGVPFLSAAHPIELRVEGGLPGPTPAQREFFKTVRDRYDELAAVMSPLIEQEFRKWKRDFAIKNFRQEFTPVYLTIPKMDTPAFAWEFSFETLHDENHQMTVRFEGFEPAGIVVDG